MPWFWCNCDHVIFLEAPGSESVTQCEMHFLAKCMATDLRVITGDEMEQTQQTLIETKTDTALFDAWYLQDDNVVPKVFILQTISSILKKFNNQSCPTLMKQNRVQWAEIVDKLQL
ncbi:hypothetical protein CAPTEDRAFT_204560 [Capitella teleta]|uniref:Uncharacterized protein n=1 Tax=Capitella teleta TaxID=283909 RepID=R7TW99_CAPTE|nr:hypothetical protein CAPTEDRAFT_204560 [Capitella teleta]|eukprot:ELT98014.1 hypothetical protein CAPTEDRAFT_204560 [Capitella teleta]